MILVNNFFYNKTEQQAFYNTRKLFSDVSEEKELHKKIYLVFKATVLFYFKIVQDIFIHSTQIGNKLIGRKIKPENKLITRLLGSGDTLKSFYSKNRTTIIKTVAVAIAIAGTYYLGTKFFSQSNPSTTSEPVSLRQSFIKAPFECSSFGESLLISEPVTPRQSFIKNPFECFKGTANPAIENKLDTINKLKKTKAGYSLVASYYIDEKPIHQAANPTHSQLEVEGKGSVLRSNNKDMSEVARILDPSLNPTKINDALKIVFDPNKFKEVLKIDYSEALRTLEFDVENTFRTIIHNSNLILRTYRLDHKLINIILAGYRKFTTQMQEKHNLIKNIQVISKKFCRKLQVNFHPDKNKKIEISLPFGKAFEDIIRTVNVACETIRNS